MISREQTYTSETSERYKEFARRLGEVHDPLCEKVMLCFNSPGDRVSIEEMSKWTGYSKEEIEEAIGLLPNIILLDPRDPTSGRYQMAKYVKNIM